MGWVILAIIVLLVIWVVGIYNGLVSARNGYKNAFAQIDVQLTRRHDLIPNLVETARGYLAHERGTLEAVITARNAAVSGGARLPPQTRRPGRGAAARRRGRRALTGALESCSRLAEAYPDLKANKNMMQLSEELTTTENKVAFARQSYNDAVMGYNNRREMFPGSVFAGSFNFLPAQLLEIESPEKREVPKVSFT